MTFSGDGTTHRGIQFYAQHANYTVESSAPDGSKTKEHVTRFLGIHAPLDGTGKQSIKAWKETLAEDAFQESTNEELLPVLMEARSKMIEAVGGTAKWKALSESTQADHEAKMMEEAIKKLGKDAFENLDDNEKHIMKLFIWAGC